MPEEPVTTGPGSAEGFVHDGAAGVDGLDFEPWCEDPVELFLDDFWPEDDFFVLEEDDFDFELVEDVVLGFVFDAVLLVV
ncbi:MAG TPA: hypothetical protein VG223_16565 [Solirubrobacteraceae bacterium]|nr:hypothetical protein [Solirubrobacteraceae bacterium]